MTTVSHLLALLILFAGVALASVAGLLAWDDVRARELAHGNARRWDAS